jgi:hypothetical protein
MGSPDRIEITPEMFEAGLIELYWLLPTEGVGSAEKRSAFVKILAATLTASEDERVRLCGQELPSIFPA